MTSLFLMSIISSKPPDVNSDSCIFWLRFDSLVYTSVNLLYS
jgi:hypothetical protein